MRSTKETRDRILELHLFTQTEFVKGEIRALLWTLGEYPVGESTFSYARTPDGSNPVWEKFKALYPPDERGVSLAPGRVVMDNAVFDFEAGAIMVTKPEQDTQNFIFHAREATPGKSPA